MAADPPLASGPPIARPPELKALTGLRFLAALPVVLFHVLPRPAMSPEAGKLADLGYISVGLFFVLSGFVLSYAYSGDAETINRRAFYRARFARIYPVYALAMLVALPAYTRLYPSLKLQWWEYPVDVALRFLLVHAWHPGTIRHYNVPSWSLSVEAFFYLLFPFLLPVVFRLTPKETPRSLVMVLALASVAPLAYSILYPGMTAALDSYRILLIKFHPLVRLPEFLGGMLLGRLFVGAPPAWQGWQSDLAVAGAVATIVAAVALGMPYPLLHTGGLAIPFAVIVYALATGKGLFAQALSWRPIMALGGASYALYILHLPLFSIFEKRAAAIGITIGTLPFAFGVTCALIAVSLVVHYVFELPMRKWLR